MPITLEHIEREKLADKITLYRRNGEVIYQNELKNGEWIHKPQAHIALETERNRPFSLQEQRNYVNEFDKLAKLLARPERKASAEEVSHIEKLREQAKKDLTSLENRYAKKPKQ